MTTWQAMHRLEQLGYTFTLDEAGKILAHLIGGMKPAEALEGVRNTAKTPGQLIREGMGLK